MKPAELVREMIFPLKDLTVLMAIAGISIVLWLALAAAMWLPHIGWLLGLLLALFIIPAAFRYALYLLEARAHGKDTLVAGPEVLNIADNFWGLFPLVLLSASIWLAWYVAKNVSLQSAQLLLAVLFLIYPASLAVLGITRSPIDSLNPVMLYRMIRACGVDYVWIPLVLIVVMLLAAVLMSSGLPTPIVIFVGLYVFFLMFSLTGAVLNANGIAGEVGIEAPIERSESELLDDLQAERQKIANHAYGFISRGNRDGGFQHIRQWIESEPDTGAAVSWFFKEMMRWESKDAALFFAQDCLAHFLHHDEDAKALKLMSTCLHENPRWKPRAEDRGHALELAERCGRDDLVSSLRG